MQSRPPLQQEPEFSQLLNASTLANIVSHLKAEDIVNLRLVNQGLSVALTENHHWRSQVERYFHDDYKKFQNKPNVHWFSLFKHLYDRHYSDLPARTVKICSSVCFGDVAALKQLNLVHDDLFLKVGRDRFLWELIASTQNQPLMDYIFQGLVMPHNVPGMDNKTQYRLLSLAAAFNQGGVISEMGSVVAELIHWIDVYDRTSPLHLAAQHGHVDVIRRLVFDGGVNINSVSKSGRTPLEAAAKSGRVDAVEALFDFGASKENLGRLLHLAAQSGDYGTFNAIAKTGVSFSILDDGLSTLLHSAVRGRNIEIVNAVFKDRKDMQVDVVDELGQTPLHLAAQYGCVDIFNKLLLLGALLSKITKDGSSILHYAAEGREPAIVNFMISQNMFDFNIKNKLGVAPLHRVFSCKHQFNHEVIGMLVRAGADVNMKTSTSIYNGEYFEGKETPLHYAVCREDRFGVKALLDVGADVNAVSPEGETPIFYAVAVTENHTTVTIFNMLLDAGADINFKVSLSKRDSVDRGFVTLLHQAVSYGALPMVERLLKLKANVRALDPPGCTPLHSAVCLENTAIVEALLEAGSPIDCVDDCGRTPFDLCVISGKVQHVEAFVRRGAVLNPNSWNFFLEGLRFSDVSISGHALAVVLRAASRIIQLKFGKINILPASPADPDFSVLEGISLPYLTMIDFTGCDPALVLPLLKAILKVSPAVKQVICPIIFPRSKMVQLTSALYSMYQELFESHQHRYAGRVIAEMNEDGYNGVCVKNLPYAKKIYALIGDQGSADRVQQTINRALARSQRLFSTPAEA
ncbi:MAG TPA: ankyrin repeat domain-containing protein, partial [Gammaproteobacteria bacterium]|nr:ankyrin repeat domain-containing protein [Gammaproteobacteria bacterium]